MALAVLKNTSLIIKSSLLVLPPHQEQIEGNIT
jgi:hypothetical protein